MTNTLNESSIKNSNNQMDHKNLSDIIDISALTQEEVKKYEQMLADTNPIASGVYIGRTFRDVLSSEGSMTVEKIRNIEQISKPQGH
jgi:hypothetical protein